MSQIPALTGGRRLSHDAISDKGFYTIGVGGKCQIFSDFMGGGQLPLTAGVTSGYGTLFFNEVHRGGGGVAPELTHIAEANGVYRMNFSTENQKQQLCLYMNDDCVIPPTKNPIFEARCRITGTFSSDDRVVIGLASSRGTGDRSPDSILDHVWFKLEGANTNILVEGDDRTRDNDDNDTGKDYTPAIFHTFKIDMRDLSDVRFFVDGDRCALPEKMDVSGLAAGNLLQPFIEIQKDTGAVAHAIDIDYISVLWDRS
tara:strand:+ start:974 stop:1744 length:771 start_codon:yes stop_codon:yes gene_type:complete